ncbi:homogentisate 1,2-dioxygenase [Acidiferrimicrobium sp. IK]|uniref:homogentisate 1,2-dioxygenase n=1 Tax=Acidiferrimicrobium sp. IK TaxID=2871700 RepID=UPI0021CB89A3|nr:homogentisate 1,2-dioxygenase [Acidiferrimicrobium sp. IK]MCU4185401.1 homogentisate 1,2-dioxygenase [Acidiferrimicrobium sp. IK]
MPYYRAVGEVPAKRHLRGAFEELVGEEGFSGASSLLYHRNSPSALLAVDALESGRPALQPNHPLSPRHLQTAKLADTADPVTGRHILAGTPTCTLAWWSGGAGTSPLYRDATGDTLAYLQQGTMRLETAFGHLALSPGDYAVIPAGAVHRFVSTGPASLLLIEAHGGHVDIPARYLTAGGQLREGAPYSERDIRAPRPSSGARLRGPVEVLVRTRAGLTRHVMAHHPFDVVGWDGCAYPWAINILDFEPVTGRIHQPPPVHQTFQGPRFVVCSFVPRPYDFEPGALKIPYHHANVDSDEVLFYSRGDFMSRAGAGINAGSMTLHPAGFTHGPQPGALERSASQDGTEEVAVMIDTFDPLGLSEPARQAEDPTYWGSWAS